LGVEDPDSRELTFRAMRARTLSLALILAVGCNANTATDDDDGTPQDSGSTPVDTGTPDSGNTPADTGTIVPDAGQVIEEDAGQQQATIISGGDVSGAWCGNYEVNGSVTVPAGETLTICAGSEIGFRSNVGFDVQGTLTIDGASDAVRMSPLGVSWVGVNVTGTLNAAGVDISGATNCIRGFAGSSIDVNNAVLSCNFGLRLANGGVFRNVTVNGGSTVIVDGGHFDMADSVIDLGHPTAAPDCTDWNGGSATIDHSRFTGCHCPLHFNSATGPITVTNSIFDDASIPVMIASSQATFTHNHFLGTGPGFLDIGGPFTADVSGNYWGGGAPDLSSDNLSQFTGADDYSTTPFTDVGPR
jgi:hypothetical protein